MRPKHRWLIFWVGVGIATLGGAMIMIQIDNLAWDRPVEVAGLIAGVAATALGAALFGWAGDDE